MGVDRAKQILLHYEFDFYVYKDLICFGRRNALTYIIQETDNALQS